MSVNWPYRAFLKAISFLLLFPVFAFAQVPAGPVGGQSVTVTSVLSSPLVIGVMGSNWIPANQSGVLANEYANYALNLYWYNATVYPTLALYESAASVAFARSQADYFVNGSGVITSAGSGVLRQTYDPSTLSPLGALLEGSRVQNLKQTQDLCTTWTLAGITRSCTGVAAPDGTSTADVLTEDTSNGQHRVAQATVAATSGTTYGYSSYPKIASCNAARDEGACYVRLAIATTFAALSGYFDIQYGIVGTLGAGVANAGIKRYQNGYWLAWLTGAATTTGNGSTTVAESALDNQFSYVGDGASGTNWWQTQFENGSPPSSSMPVTTVNFTRTTDALTRTRTLLSAGIDKVLWARAALAPGATSQTLWSIGTNATNNCKVTRATDRHIHVSCTDSGSTTTDMDLGSSDDDYDLVVSLRLQGTNCAAAINGGSPVIDNACTLPAVFDGSTSLTERWGASATAGEEWFSTMAAQAEWLP